MTPVDRFNAATPTRLDLAKLMRVHHVTIRDLARRMGVPMKRVREVRAMDRVPYVVACDYIQTVTGRDVFCRPRFDAMCRQFQELREGCRR